MTQRSRPPAGPAPGQPLSRENAMQVSADLDRLFASARANGGPDFIFTLTRVEGMSCDSCDPLLLGREARDADGEMPAEARRDLFKLAANLLRCAASEPYLAFAEADERTVAGAARRAGYFDFAESLESGNVFLSLEAVTE